MMHVCYFERCFDFGGIRNIDVPKIDVDVHGQVTANVMPPARLELTTLALEVLCSIRLSYGGIIAVEIINRGGLLDCYLILIFGVLCVASAEGSRSIRPP